MQKRGFSYTVEYGKPSLYNPAKYFLFSLHCSKYFNLTRNHRRVFETAQEAKFHGLQEVTRLALNGTYIRDLIIEEYCLNCNGNGVIYKPYKRIKYKKQELKCPVCKGKNSLVKII